MPCFQVTNLVFTNNPFLIEFGKRKGVYYLLSKHVVLAEHGSKVK